MRGSYFVAGLATVSQARGGGEAGMKKGRERLLQPHLPSASIRPPREASLALGALTLTFPLHFSIPLDLLPATADGATT